MRKPSPIVYIIGGFAISIAFSFVMLVYTIARTVAR